MRRFLAACLAVVLLLAASAASASFHLWTVEQLYSNADGTVQFMVVTTTASGENFLAGQTVVTIGSGGPKSFTFPTNLPGDTAGKRLLIATTGFAALGVVTPDYTVPSGFLSLNSGQINWPGGQMFSYSALPTDGVSALDKFGSVVPNVATNYAGQTGSVQPTASISPQPGNWSNPNEQGTGYSFDFKHGVLVVVFFSFQANGAPQWYIAAGPVSGTNWTGTLFKFVNGQCIASSCPYVFPTVAGNDGDVSIVFSSNTAGMMTLPGGRVIPITPTAF